MHTKLPIAIVGGGPAGALAAALLADGGRHVLLFDERLAWEKPCGGGLTHKALQQYPFLGDARDHGNLVENCELISPSGLRVSFQMQHPVAIFSRTALNGFLLERARRAGSGPIDSQAAEADNDAPHVEVHIERVTRVEAVGAEWRLLTPQTEYRAAYLIMAAGARNPFRSQFLSPIAPDDLMVTAGYFIPNRGFSSDGSLMQIQFLQGITGYIWAFPRTDHVSAGIAGKMGEIPTAKLRCILERWLEQNGFRLDGARFYSHILPSLRAQTFEELEVCGEGWAMIGDSAGLVDPITGEGLYYALRSAELCAQSLLAGHPVEYKAQLEKEILPELKLAARVSQRFYHGLVFGDSVLEQIVSLTTRSASFRELMSDLFAGIQGYRDLRSRLYRILPSVMAEGFAATVRSPWNKSELGKFAADPVID